MVKIFTVLCRSVGLSSTHLHCSNPGKKEDVKKKPFRAAFHRHEEGDGAYVKLGSRHQGAPNPVVHSAYIVESLQDFLIKFDMKPCIHVMEISIFSLYHVIVRPYDQSRQKLGTFLEN